ncbi:hypothetical protein BGZ49_009938 [Haplosporangium sp. Z 27]|nr:hypothetical protein BGZ49_009938 [Haplosporangium sp. Z 27]
MEFKQRIIEKHRNSIRHLKFKRCYDPEIYTPVCTRLITLKIQHSSYHLQAEVLDSLPQWIRTNTNTLENFTFNGYSPISKDIWIALAQCPNLRKVWISCTELSNNTEFWQVCSKVENLSIVASKIVSETDDLKAASTPSIPLPKLQHLTFHARLRKIDFDIVLNAPNLKSLTWTPNRHFPNEEFQRVMSKRKLPLLQSLVLTPFNLQDEDIALTLDAMTDAKDLELDKGYFSKKALHSLISRHSTTIRKLVLPRSEFPTGAMVQTIMSTCPSLEEVEFSSINGADLVRIDQVNVDDANGDAPKENIVLAKDWLCLGLRSLFITFRMSPSMPDLELEDPVKAEQLKRQQRLEQEHAFRQLSRLEQLRTLNIESPRGYEESLDLRLESNGGQLDKLASLKKLESINIQRTYQQMGKDEIHWILKNWPKLQYWSGTFDRNHVDLNVYFKQLHERNMYK